MLPAIHRTRITAAMLMSFCLGDLTAAMPELRQRRRWTIPQGETEENQPPTASMKFVRTLRFSPDGQHIAIAVGKNQLLIISVENTATTPVRIRLRTPVNYSSMSPSIFWSSSGSHLLICTRAIAAIVPVTAAGMCEIQDATVVGGFAGETRVLVARYEPSKSGLPGVVNSTTVSMYRPDCSLEGSWTFRGRIDQMEPTVDGNAIAVLPDQSDIRMLESTTGKLLVRYSAGWMGSTSMRLGGGGRVLCLGTTWGLGPLECYDAGSAVRVARHQRIKGGGPFDLAASRSVLVATEGVARYNPFTENSSFRAKWWVIWDYGRGRDIARLKHRVQRSALHGTESFAVAISPDGKTLAVAGDGVLDLYDIPD